MLQARPQGTGIAAAYRRATTSPTSQHSKTLPFDSFCVPVVQPAEGETDDTEEYMRLLRQEEDSGSESGATDSASNSSSSSSSDDDDDGDDHDDKTVADKDEKPTEEEAQQSAAADASEGADDTDVKSPSATGGSKGEEKVPAESTGSVKAAKAAKATKKPAAKAFAAPYKDSALQRQMELLDPKITARFGEVVWAKLGTFPWWPGYIYDPRACNSKLRDMAQKSLSSKYLVYFYESNQYGQVGPHALLPNSA